MTSQPSLDELRERLHSGGSPVQPVDRVSNDTSTLVQTLMRNSRQLYRRTVQRMRGIKSPVLGKLRAQVKTERET